MKRFVSSVGFILVLFSGLFLGTYEATRYYSGVNQITERSAEFQVSLEKDLLSYSPTQSPNQSGEFRNFKITSHKVRQKNENSGADLLGASGFKLPCPIAKHKNTSLINAVYPKSAFGIALHVLNRQFLI